MIGAEAFRLDAVVNRKVRHSVIVREPRPALLLWASEEQFVEYPFQPLSVLELGFAEIESASPEQLTLVKVLKRDPAKGRATQSARKIVTLDFQQSGKIMRGPGGNPGGVEVYQVLTQIGVPSMMPELVHDAFQNVASHKRLPAQRTRSAGAAQPFEGRLSKRQLVEPTPSAAAMERERPLSRVATIVDDSTKPDAKRSLLSDHFELHELLGEGGFANVYRATHRETSKDVAVKIMLLSGPSEEAAAAAEAATIGGDGQPDGGGGDEEGQPAEVSAHAKRIREFEWEIRVMKRIKAELPFHANLVRLFAVCTAIDPLRTCLVMEKMDGGELFDRIVERSHYTEKDASFLFRTLVRTVHSLHKARILHRDLKPENILFADKGFYSNVKICDFGTAMFMDMPDQDPFHGRTIGSPGYTSPEVLQKGMYTPACDVWSLGVILYVLLVGYLPFPEGFMQKLKVITGKFEFLEEDWQDISPEARDLISKMLARRVSDRITTEDILAHPWVVNVDLDRDHEEKDLVTVQSRMRTLNLRRRFKASALAAVWSARLRLNRMLKDRTVDSIRNGLGIPRGSKAAPSI